MNKEIPEKAILTGSIESDQNPETYEPVYFRMKDSVHEFSIGFSDVLKCVEFAEKEGLLPELPREWWGMVKRKYEIPFDA